MTKEFIEQFDKLANIEEAEYLAYDLGYWEYYLDGATISSPTYIKEMKNKITSLCGGEWTSSVLSCYEQGQHDGYMDT